MARPEKHVFVCTHSRSSDDPKGSCAASGSQAIVDAFASEFESRGLWGRFKLNTSSCFGTCENNPSVLVYPEGVMYQKIAVQDVVTIIEEHLLGDKSVDALKMPKEVWS
jgi:(2Fe-2S) ferredoxin